MPTTCLKKSGNRRSENNPGSGTAPAKAEDAITSALSDTPRISNQGFKFPGTPPIQPIPSIKEAMRLNAPVNPAPIAQENLSPGATEPSSEPRIETEPVGDSVQPLSDSASDTSVSVNVSDDKGEEDFMDCWHQLFEELFANNPMIYHPLKDRMPTLEDGTIRIEVLNDFQKEQLEMRKRAVLEYWRAHFSTNVDDFEIQTNEHLEVKKIIYSSDDKLANMQEQNPALLAFLNELNFRIRD